MGDERKGGIESRERQGGELKAGELVHLNVGGLTAVTTRTTLCARGGMLAAIFGGDMAPSHLQDEAGRYFIDRWATCRSTS